MLINKLNVQMCEKNTCSTNRVDNIDKIVWILIYLHCKVIGSIPSAFVTCIYPFLKKLIILYWETKFANVLKGNIFNHRMCKHRTTLPENNSPNANESWLSLFCFISVHLPFLNRLNHWLGNKMWKCAKGEHVQLQEV